ncbi:uncharacterized protein METZ01_LOCUS82822 [marine metagenome]|uniref:TonB-dependent receptor-like beta-barrel domain-containing protein n=1 Tax=marine metagenome TaxID=408172 RepID=A0A381UQR4_9ZZZZ
MNAPVRYPMLAVVAFSIAVQGQANGQIIPLKTVPVATGDQFLILPSQRLGMGSVGIALDDNKLDLFVNPAKGALVEESVLLGVPTFYGISDQNGAGRTLPLSALLRGDRAFGGFSFALQQIEGGQRNDIFLPMARWIGPPQQLRELSARNIYANGVFGMELGTSGLSLGGGISWSGLGAVDGVEHLYALSSDIDQSGHLIDYRIGIFSNRDDRHFEAVLLHNRFEMTHDVTYLDWVWNPPDEGVLTSRIETNLDHTRTTGLHLGFARPITESGWRAGGSWTVNRKTHPKIPNYEIMNIPRDPGISWAYEFGIGIAKSKGPATFGVDLLVQPIWSDTWAEAEADTTGWAGEIRKGERTIENEFFFANVKMRMGMSYDIKPATVQMGVEVRSYDYTLVQRNNLEGTIRDQDESWMEWTPSLGVQIRFPELELGYVGRVTTGSGRPGVQWTGARAEAMLSSDFIIAPSGPLTLQDALVLTHQLSISIPIR